MDRHARPPLRPLPPRSPSTIPGLTGASKIARGRPASARASAALVGALVAACASACVPDVDPALPPPPGPGFIEEAIPSAIVIDGRFEDWEAVPVAALDPLGDAGAAVGIDMATVKIAHDSGHLFLMVDLGVEISLSQEQYLRLYLDTDDDASTGIPFAGLGAELEWTFGQRAGWFVAPSEQLRIDAHAIGLRTAPTITSRRFEIALPRAAAPDGLHKLFVGDRVRVAFKDNTYNEDFVADGDQVPDPGGALTYEMVGESIEPEAIGIGRDEGDALRVVSWNVLQSGIFDPDRRPRFERILKALDPDVINFQELYSPEGIDRLVGGFLPGPWAVETFGDRTTLSRLPIEEGWPLAHDPLHYRFTMVPIQVQGRRLVIFNAHMSFGSKDFNRQQEADSFIATLRDMMTPGGVIDTPEGTPFVLLGDLNLVGQARQLDTLLTGAIADQAAFGPSHAPDWGGGPLTDLSPRQNTLPMAWTWRSEGSDFWPGRLDFFIYTGSVIDVRKSFVLNTEAMTEAELAAFGLQREDTLLASDHLPVVVDLKLRDL